MSVSYEEIRKNLLSSAINLNNEAIRKLMFSIHRNSIEMIDEKTKLKDITRLGKHLTESLKYLNSSVQLNVLAYTTLGEAKAVSTAHRNYQAFINQTLLSDGTKSNHLVAWLIDNSRKEDDGQFLKMAKNLSNKIETLITNKSIENGHKKSEKVEEKICKYPKCHKEIPGNKGIFCSYHKKSVKEKAKTIGKSTIAVAGTAGAIILTVIKK